MQSQMTSLYRRLLAGFKFEGVISSGHSRGLVAFECWPCAAEHGTAFPDVVCHWTQIFRRASKGSSPCTWLELWASDIFTCCTCGPESQYTRVQVCLGIVSSYCHSKHANPRPRARSGANSKIITQCCAQGRLSCCTWISWLKRLAYTAATCSQQCVRRICIFVVACDSAGSGFRLPLWAPRPAWRP